MSTDSQIADLLKPMYVNRTTITTEWARLLGLLPGTGTGGSQPTTGSMLLAVEP
jgi:hypothetical protein